MSAAVEHIGEIESVVSGVGSARDRLVIESWQRCVHEHGLDPANPTPAVIIPDRKLREHREQSERLIRIARSGMQELFRKVSGQNYVLLLCDRDGVTVDFFGDLTRESQLRRAGLYLGAVWTEHIAGTSGVGSCLATGEAMVIHQTDHFDLTHTPLSCTAAPIFDTDGVLRAVLDVSLLRPPTPKSSQRLALHLVNAAVRRIELANMMTTMRSHWVLRLAHSPDFLDVDPEAAIAVDASGRVVGTTHSAQQLMARAAGVDWRTPGAIVGQPMSKFFNLSIDELPNLIAKRPTEERLVRLGDGSAVFGHAIEPVARPPRARPYATIPAPLHELSGDDPQMRALEDKAARLARGPLSILLSGETGSGKERLARAIHASRPERGPFIAVNCAALPASLIEGELFGHAPGAFSGALSQGRPGLIEAADGGVLFLDEIGDMPYALQARLLRVLSEGTVTRLGEHHPRSVCIKVISATHHDLQQMVRDNRFRADLFFRLAAITLQIPPLRERADLGWLIDQLLRERSIQLGSRCRLRPDARIALLKRRWPGNIRELINTLDVASTLCNDGVIGLDDLPAPPLAPTPPAPAPDSREALTQALVACDWNISEAARMLEVDRTTVHRRMRKLGISRP